MTASLFCSGLARRRFLLGTGAALIAAVGAPPLQAREIGALQGSVNHQAQVDVIVRASVNDPVIRLEGGVTGASDLDLSGNAIRADARGNVLVSRLAIDGQGLAGSGPAWLATGRDEVVSAGAATIATAQSHLRSPIYGEVLGASISLEGGDVRGGRLTVSGNSLEAGALANDAVSSLTLTGGVVEGSGGVAGYQSIDRLSPVAAPLRGRFTLRVGDVTDGVLTQTDNLLRATASANSASHALAVQAASVIAPASQGPGSTVPKEGDGRPEVRAAYGVLNHQVAASAVTASYSNGSAPAFEVGVAGDVADAWIRHDANTIVVAAQGNQAANGLDLNAVSIGRSGSEAQVNLANVTNVQRLGYVAITAAEVGGVISHIQGDVTGSRVSTSGNVMRALATGNRADGNLLTVKANTIDAGAGHDGEGTGAILHSDGSPTAHGAISVQNAQDYGTGAIIAYQRNSDVDLVVAGNAADSALRADENLAVLAATGNAAVNGLRVEATTLNAAVSLNASQIGRGDIQTLLGKGNARSGAMVAIKGDLADAVVSVAGNRALGTATGNAAENTLSVSAGAILNGDGPAHPVAGSGAGGTGANAAYALANHQRLGDGAWASISSEVIGGYAVEVGGAVARSAIRVDNNHQVANAIGNAAVNRLEISATRLVGDQGAAVGSAVSSVQDAFVYTQAVSDMKVSGPGGGAGASISLSQNSNRALAVANDVDNALTIDAVRAAAALGDHVLNTRQTAKGRVEAQAINSLGHEGSGVLDGSRLLVGDNSAWAEASANRALNIVSVTGRGETGAGLVNDQSNRAIVTVSALTTLSQAPSGPSGDTSVVTVQGNEAVALARGNAAINSLTLTNNGGAAQASAMVLNQQVNEGSVRARSESTAHGLILTGIGVENSQVRLTDNSAVAEAYGNMADNRIVVTSTDRPPMAAITNIQTNHGAVSAQLVGPGYAALFSSAAGSALANTGNRLAATAIGNQAITSIASQR